MKIMSEWFEAAIDNVSRPHNRSSVLLLLLLVLVLGAGSLYVLVNSPA